MHTYDKLWVAAQFVLFQFCLPFHQVFITIIYVGVLANRINVVTPRDQFGQSANTSVSLLFIVQRETHANIVATLTTTIYIHLPVLILARGYLSFRHIHVHYSGHGVFCYAQIRKLYYFNLFLVTVFYNKCPLSILTQVFVSYFSYK